MKKNFSALCAGLVVAVVISGCSDDDFGNGQDGNRPSAGTTVNFTLGGPSTRTIYDDEDEYQINWSDNDQVRIYCEEAEDVKQADYTVLKDETNEETGTLQYNENGLAWGGENTHNFYAVYPADNNKVSVDNGIASFRVNQNQTCTFPAEATNGNYMGSPDMTNAYMVAYYSSTPIDEVPLNFKPIMTTLQITLRGRENPNENQSFIAVTGLSIIRQVSNTENEGYFQYDITNGKMQDGTGSGSFTQTTFVGVSHNGQAYIDLQPGESMTFTVFLPPIDINAQNPITIRPNVAGNTELDVIVQGQMIDGEALAFAASSKGKLTLPVWPTEEVTGNNWITPLDDNIYVQQLSIPGAHDAAANSTSLMDVGVTQGLTLQEQWDLGIRAFDLRAAWYDNDGGIFTEEFHGMWLWHGFTRTGLSLDGALQIIKGKLDENEREFAIVQLRHESEAANGKDTGRWATDLYNAFSSYLDYIIEWRPDLTIGECRGKIIVLTRDDYNQRSLAGLISNWPENTTGTANIATGRSSTCNYYVQDLYEYTLNSGDEKIEAFESLMSTTTQFCNSTSEYFMNKSWAMNHISGYSSYFGIGGTQEYIWNAEQVALPIQQAIAGLTSPGPLGMVMMDFAGMRTASGWLGIGGTEQTVNCDLLTQTIIDNNYRYTMLRKDNTGN